MESRESFRWMVKQCDASTTQGRVSETLISVGKCLIATSSAWLSAVRAGWMWASLIATISKIKWLIVFLYDSVYIPQSFTFEWVIMLLRLLTQVHIETSHMPIFRWHLDKNPVIERLLWTVQLPWLRRWSPTILFHSLIQVRARDMKMGVGGKGVLVLSHFEMLQL